VRAAGARLEQAIVEDGEVATTDARIDYETGAVTVDGEDVTADVSECSVCKEIVRFVCDNGCDLGAAAICAAIGLVTGPGGIICSLIAIPICDQIDLSEDCDRTAESVCEDFGYC